MDEDHQGQRKEVAVQARYGSRSKRVASVLSSLGIVKVKKCNTVLVAYGSADFKIKTVGQIKLSCSKSNCTPVDIVFVVVDAKEQMPLLGLGACQQLKLISKIESVSDKNVKLDSLKNLKEQYPVVFVGVGKFGNKHHISLKDNTVPRVQPVRRVPHSLRDRLKTKLEYLEGQGIVRKVEGPTEWLHPLVIVEKKNGDLRLCLDPKHLNDAIKREHFLIPTVEEISSKLAGKAFFTVLDMKDGYWQVEIDDASADL